MAIRTRSLAVLYSRSLQHPEGAGMRTFCVARTLVRMMRYHYMLHRYHARPSTTTPDRIKIMANRTVAVASLLVLAACAGKKEDGAAMDTAAAPAAAMDSAPVAAATGAKDIVETAVAAGTFNTLAKALTEAGLVETLKGAGPYTVLAPTDEAFAKIPAKDLEALLADKAALTKVLTYHVIAGNVPASQVTTMTEATTLEGGKVTIKVEDGKVVLNGNSTVTTADVAASNGVIHVINTVLMPPKM